MCIYIYTHTYTYIATPRDLGTKTVMPQTQAVNRFWVHKIVHPNLGALFVFLFRLDAPDILNIAAETKTICQKHVLLAIMLNMLIMSNHTARKVILSAVMLNMLNHGESWLKYAFFQLSCWICWMFSGTMGWISASSVPNDSTYSTYTTKRNTF